MVTVELSADPERTVVIPITRTHQNGATGGDYSGVPASVSFSATETSKTFRFAATQDMVDDDDDESVELGGFEGASATRSDPTRVTVSFGESSYTAGEGSGVTVTVGGRRSRTHGGDPSTDNDDRRRLLGRAASA